MWPFSKKQKKIKNLESRIEILENHLSVVIDNLADIKEAYKNHLQFILGLLDENTQIENSHFRALQLTQQENDEKTKLLEQNIKDFFGILQFAKSRENSQILKNGGMLYDMLTQLKECYYFVKKNTK